MKTSILAITFLTLVSCKETKTESVKASKVTAIEQEEKKDTKEFKINPISHATMVLEWDGTTIYVDPVAEPEAFKKYGQPDLILVTDIHGDHFNANSIQGLQTDRTKIIVPQAVVEKMPEVSAPQLDILSNGESKERFGFTTTAIPMYNLREEALKYHSKGRGNGYVIEKDGIRIYISGDTEDIPEMRDLKDIDIAFVCMNLPYTMTVESAVSAVLDFKPKKVYPYHYRGTEGMSDVSKFKELVNKGNPDIKVSQLDWYPAH